MKDFLVKNKDNIVLIFTGIMLAIGMILENVLDINKYIFLAIYLPIYLICGHKALIKAVRNIFHGELLDENFLMSIASIGAFIIGQYSEAVAVMLFYNIGEYFQKKAVNKSRKSIKKAVDIREKFANKKDGENIIKVPSKQLKIGDIIVVYAGEKIAVDGVVLKGNSAVNMSALTGESLPVDVGVGDNVLSGTINVNGVIEVQVEKLEKESTAAKIVELIENASINKSKSETFITKFAKIYTPFVVIVALIVGLIPPIFDGLWQVWIYRALSLLVISCPCAIVISVPLAFFSAIGNVSKQGILIKGGGYLEKLREIDTFVFDKTGTLTKGDFFVTKVNTTTSKENFFKILASLESYSNHPISKAITSEYSSYIDKNILKNVEEISGKGITADLYNSKIFAGKYEFLAENGVKFDRVNEVGSVVYLAVDNNYLGYVVVKDELKDSAISTINKLKKLGKNVIMLTGDNEQVMSEINEKLNIKAYCNLLPSDKLNHVENLINNGKKVCYVGDGINDAPVLKRADVSIAMGNNGQDIAVDSADIVLLNDDISKVISSIDLSKKTTKIVVENIVFSLLTKLIVFILTSVGITSMWLAIFSDVGVMILCILNSVRLLNNKIK